MTSTMERPRIEIKINPDVMDIKWEMQSLWTLPTIHEIRSRAV